MRPLILGLDTRSGGFGFLRGLPYWNMNLGIKKGIRITERFNAEASINFITFSTTTSCWIQCWTVLTPAASARLRPRAAFRAGWSSVSA